MNRSYSKIRHIQEVNQRLEKRFISENNQQVQEGWNDWDSNSPLSRGPRKQQRFKISSGNPTDKQKIKPKKETKPKKEKPVESLETILLRQERESINRKISFLKRKIERYEATYEDSKNNVLKYINHPDAFTRDRLKKREDVILAELNKLKDTLKKYEDRVSSINKQLNNEMGINSSDDNLNDNDLEDV